MFKPTGSWVAIPTPFDTNGAIDFGGFETLIDFHVTHGTSALLVMGSAGEVTMLSLEERQAIIKRVSKISKGRIPTFYGTTFPTTEDTVKFSRFAESEGADGIVLTVPPYLLLSQEAVLEHMKVCMQSISIPAAIYNNPTRVGVNIAPETIEILAHECPNFIADKEAMPHVRQLVEVRRRLGDRIHLLCCDYPKYSIVLANLGLGGHGAANIGGNIIPEEMAKISKPWDSMEQIGISRELYFKYYNFLEKLYLLSNPIVIKAALKILGLPSGGLRRPYLEFKGEQLGKLKDQMKELGIIERYGK